MSFCANKIASGRKYCKNEIVHNFLIINNKNFFDKKLGCNWCPIGVRLRLNRVAISAQLERI